MGSRQGGAPHGRCFRSAPACVVVLACLVSMWSPPSRAQSTAAVPNGAGPNVGLSRLADPYAGVVLDSTVTFIGQEFYRDFVSLWREQPRSERYSLTVIERPSARWGSLVYVEYMQRRLFTAFLSPGRRDQIRGTAHGAVQAVYQNVVDADIQRLLFKDPDLGPEEF